MTAILSECRKYRYLLTRETGLDNTKTVVFIGINPSTADEVDNDPTVRKWLGFAKRWGFGRIVVVNLFAYRHKDPKALAAAVDPVGQHNAMHQVDAIYQAALIVPCWGRLGKLPKSLQPTMLEMLSVLRAARHAKVKCFGKTKCGQPMHPLMLGYDTELVPL